MCLPEGLEHTSFRRLGQKLNFPVSALLAVSIYQFKVLKYPKNFTIMQSGQVIDASQIRPLEKQ